MKSSFILLLRSEELCALGLAVVSDVSIHLNPFVGNYLDIAQP